MAGVGVSGQEAGQEPGSSWSRWTAGLQAANTWLAAPQLNLSSSDIHRGGAGLTRNTIQISINKREYLNLQFTIY